jgi:hypothetical protein
MSANLGKISYEPLEQAFSTLLSSTSVGEWNAAIL